MSELIISIPSKDGIPVLTSLYKGQSKALVIFAHGLTHNRHQLLPVMMRNWSLENNFDYAAIDFYAKEKQGRRLANITLNQWVDDIKAVCHYYRDQYVKIILIAHSISGLATLIAQPEVDAVIFLDPSFDIRRLWESTKPLLHTKEEGVIHLDYGLSCLISKKLVEEVYQYNGDKCLKLAEKFNIPCQLVIPSESVFLTSATGNQPEDFARTFPNCSLNKIKDGNHTFSLPGNIKELQTATDSFIKKSFTEH